MSRFGIIIPTYKSPEFITWVVDSLIAQTFGDWEAVLVDDFSDDTGVVTALEEAAARDGRIRVFSQSSNQGQSAARNRGLSEINSDYVIFLDFDDLLFPWSLETFHHVIESEGRPLFVAGSAVPLERDQRTWKGASGNLSVRRFRDYFEYRISEKDWWFVPSGAALKTSLVKEVGGFWETRVYCEDIDLWSRLGNDVTFLRIDSPPLYGYRLHSGSAHHDWSRMHAGVMRVIDIEKAGGYPGGRKRKGARVRIFASHARHHAAEFVTTRPDLALDLYTRTFGWNLRLCRWNFIFGLPVLAARSWIGKMMARVSRKEGESGIAEFDKLDSTARKNQED